MLYQKLNVENFREIQNEAIDYVKLKYPELLRDDILTDGYFIVSIENFPILKSFLDSRVTSCIEEIGLICVPPKTETLKHIDGLREDKNDEYMNRVKQTIINHPDFASLSIDQKDLDRLPSAIQFAMMVPILNYETTVNYWYNNNDVGDDEEEIRNYTREIYPYSFFASYIRPHVQLKHIASTNIDRITFIKTDTIHNVSNQGSKNRLAFTIKFGYQKYGSLEEMFRHQDLM